MEISNILSASSEKDPAEIIFAGWQLLFIYLQTTRHDNVLLHPQKLFNLNSFALI